MQPYQRSLITPLKEIPYQPYILRKYNIQPQKPYKEDNSGSNIIKPEYPFINPVYNIQNRIDKIRKENENQKSQKNILPLENSFYYPENQGKHLKKSYSLLGNGKKYKNKLLLKNNRYDTPLRGNYNHYSNNYSNERSIEDDINHLKRSYNNIQYTLDRKMEELDLKQQLNFEFLKKQLKPSSSKKSIVDNDLSNYINNLVTQKQNSFEDKIRSNMRLDNAINRHLEENLLNKYNRSFKMKEKQNIQDNRTKNILNELINDYKNDVKQKNNISLPYIKKNNYNNFLNERLKLDLRLSQQKLKHEDKTNEILDRIIELQKENEIKKMKKKLMRNQILMMQNQMIQNQMMEDQMMENQMMDYNYYPEENIRYIKRRDYPLIRRRKENEYESEESEYHKKQKVKKKKKKNKKKSKNKESENETSEYESEESEESESYKKQKVKKKKKKNKKKSKKKESENESSESESESEESEEEKEKSESNNKK